MRLLTVLCWIASLLFAASVATANSDSTKLNDEEIGKAFQGKKITDNVHYKYQLHEDGHLEGVEMYSHFTGKWYVLHNQLCWLVDDPEATEECFTVQKNREVFYFSNDLKAWSGSLYPLDIVPPQPEKI